MERLNMLLLLAFLVVRGEIDNINIQSNKNGLCLDVHGPDFHSRINGGKVQLWACHNNGPNQDFSVDELGRIRAKNNKCLDVRRSDFSTDLETYYYRIVELWDCNDHPNQRFTIDGSVIRAENGQCLDGGSPHNGAQVLLWDCLPSRDQGWKLLDIFFAKIVSSNGKCLDVHRPDYDSRKNYGKVQLWDCHNSGPNQEFRRDSLGRIVSSNGKCLTPSPYIVHLYDCDTRWTDQKWIEPRDTKEIVNADMGKCLDVDASDYDSGKNGARILLYDCHDGLNQQWNFGQHFNDAKAVIGKQLSYFENAAGDYTFAVSNNWFMFIVGLVAVLLVANAVFMCYMNCGKKEKGYSAVKYESDSEVADEQQQLNK